MITESRVQLEEEARARNLSHFTQYMMHYDQRRYDLCAGLLVAISLLPDDELAELVLQVGHRARQIADDIPF